MWGAVAGYLTLWSVYHLFKLVTGKEGMGYGDFKLLAALGKDPAQSSSILLTTVTDVVGFFSFLGLATLLSALI